MDNGHTWDVLQATGTTDANPVGNSYGFGYTGDSDGWRDGEASLGPYAGQDALVRFHYVTDDAINGPGMCVHDIKISGDADGGDAADWVADGFVRANNQVRQDWIVWVIVDGPENSSSRMNLTWDAESERVVGSVPGGQYASDGPLGCSGGPDRSRYDATGLIFGLGGGSAVGSGEVGFRSAVVTIGSTWRAVRSPKGIPQTRARHRCAGNRSIAT